MYQDGIGNLYTITQGLSLDVHGQRKLVSQWHLIGNIHGAHHVAVQTQPVQQMMHSANINGYNNNYAINTS